MTTFKSFIFIILFTIYQITGFAQDRTETYKRIEFNQLFPNERLEGLDKLSPVEKERLKIYVIDLYLDASLKGYKDGREDMFKFVMAQIGEYAKSQEVLTQESNTDNLKNHSPESKKRKTLNTFIAAITNGAQGYLQAGNGQSPGQANNPPRYGSSPSTIESRIDGDFNGFKHGNIYKLANGQIWEQTEFRISVSIKISPAVTIIPTSDGYKMLVDGVSDPVRVKRLN